MIWINIAIHTNPDFSHFEPEVNAQLKMLIHFLTGIVMGMDIYRYLVDKFIFGGK